MTESYICESDWLHFHLIILVKSSQRLGTGGVDLNRPTINFRKSFNFDIIAPSSILRFSLDIVQKVFSHIILEKCLLIKDVLQAKVSDFLMVLLSS